MKEYKVVFEKGSNYPQKTVDKFETRLNEIAATGWELKFIIGTYLIFEREK
ncbi:MAG: hypothetical protein ACW986_08840 [Promethearchaeota archaeon]|jgi:hypothetical protein